MPLSQRQRERLAELRWRGRTDLLWLGKEVLGYPDLDAEVHGPVARKLQHFPLPPVGERERYDRPTGSLDTPFEYVQPYVALDNLPEGRRRLVLDPRGFFKTTLNVVCHTVQWVLNYPDIAVLIVHARQETAEDMINEIRAHFVHCRRLRDLYPEVALDDKRAGPRGRFVVPCRQHKSRRESTVAIASMESSVAGYHYDVIKFTDVVDGTNTGTKEQCRKVIYSFSNFKNILVKPSRWIDVEGTCWHQADLYNDIILKHQKAPVEDREWAIHVRGVYRKAVKDGVYTFLPEERALPDLLDTNGHKVSWFPAKFPVIELERMRKNDPTSFACQQLNNAIGDEEDQAFPYKYFRSKSPEDLRMVPIAYYTASVDMAETQNRGSDFSVVLVCGWDGNGRCYVVDIRHGRFKPDELITEIFSVYMKWKSRGLRSIRIEETGYARGLKTSIRRQEDLSGLYLPLVFNPPDNQRSKEERILKTLQPWYRRGEVFFDATLPCLDHVVNELTWFPKGTTDDIVDALADQFQDRDWLGRETVRQESFAAQLGDSEAEVLAQKKVKQAMAKAFDKMVEGNAPKATEDTSWVDWFGATGGL